jgi:hypothetical protein
MLPSKSLIFLAGTIPLFERDDLPKWSVKAILQRNNCVSLTKKKGPRSYTSVLCFFLAGTIPLLERDDLRRDRPILTPFKSISYSIFSRLYLMDLTIC